MKEKLYSIWYKGVLNYVWATSRYEAAKKLRESN